ncbi:transglycosylase SLT domain-containing protein [Paucibacter sp. O1-1]|nr:transglycosylase SLT domain-containing protein [Paucibacter sp. O1-1]MDA3826589.1 transglycosylase SLT domain-containing protein [Paucibacter sp. O1-1]
MRPLQAARAAVVLVLQAVALLCFVLLVVAAQDAEAQTIPREAHQHKAALKRNAQMIWGLNAPVATFAAQIHQESRWRLDARSPVGALGLAQFMPATADWIGGLDGELAAREPLNPTWALRALVSYDRWLWQRVKVADDDCQRMAFVLAAYNGGLGWVYKRQRLSSTPGRCMGAACAINPGVSPASQRENAHYPEIILQRYEPLYASWGPGACP